MARTTGSDGEKTTLAIREAATSLIAQRGYEAMSMRELAAEVGVQAAALYRYFPTKQDLLFALMRDHMVSLLDAWQAAKPISLEPGERLAAFVDNHVRFHVERRHSTHVSNMELRSLSVEKLAEILRLRTAYEGALRAILREGVEAGRFDIDDVGLTAMAIIQMITGVIVWFRPEDRLSVEQIGQTYLVMTMRMVGATHLGRNGDVQQHDRLRAG